MFFLNKSLFAATHNLESGEQAFLFVMQQKWVFIIVFCLMKVSSQWVYLVISVVFGVHLGCLIRSERYFDKNRKTNILQCVDFQHIAKRPKNREIAAKTTFIFNERLLVARFLSVYRTLSAKHLRLENRADHTVVRYNWSKDNGSRSRMLLTR